MLVYARHNPGYWQASCEVIPPPQNWLFRGQKMKIPVENCVSALKLQAKTAFFGKILSLRSRISRTTSKPSRLIRPCLIDCSGVSEQPVKTFPIFIWLEQRKKKFCYRIPYVVHRQRRYGDAARARRRESWSNQVRKRGASPRKHSSSDGD